jgi:hypothetical protein
MNDRTAPANRPGLPGRPPRHPARWLSPPPNGPSLLTVILLTLSTAALGAAASGRLTWPTQSLPDNHTAIGFATLALPDTTVNVTARDEPPFAYQPPVRSRIDRILVPVLGGDGYRFSSVDLTAGPVDDPGGTFARARHRLSAAGWQVGAVDADRYGRQFTARAASTIITLAIATEVGDDGLHTGRFDPAITVRIAATPADGTRTPILLGWIAGAVLGWIAGVTATRRFARFADRRRTNLLAVSGLGMLLATPLALAGTYIGAAYQFGLQPALADPDAPWQPYMLAYLRIPALLGVAALLACIAAARPAAPHSARKAPER